MDLRLGLAVLFAALALSGCQSPVGAPASSGSAETTLPPDTPSRLPPELAAKGRQLYVTKCARCHKFYDPGVYSEAEWQTWLHKMSRKAKLDPAQEELLTKYLDNFREQRAP